MIAPKDLPVYRWPSLKVVERLYIVRDNAGRVGIGVVDRRRNLIWARPVEQAEVVPAAVVGLPHAKLITSTCWHIQDDGTYTGFWADADVPVYPAVVPASAMRTLTIVNDLGWQMPDMWADSALAGSDDPGAWDYGAKLGKVGGHPPVKGQAYNEMTVDTAVDYAREVGTVVTGRAIRLAARRGHIPGSRKVGRDWLIPYDGINHYLDHRPARGRKRAA